MKTSLHARRRSQRRRSALIRPWLAVVAAIALVAPLGAVQGVAAAQDNAPPTADAGPDQFLTVDDPALLLGAMSDDGLPDPDAVPRATWTVLSGPGSAMIDQPDQVMTTATFDAAGTYVLQLTVDDGVATSSDQTVITVAQDQPNTLRVPQDHPTVQAAVDAAQEGDLVLVAPGTYVEALSISKTITLASEYYTTGDPAMVEQTVLAAPDVLTENVVFGSGAGLGARIIGFTIRDGKDGVKVRGIASVIDNWFENLDTDAVDFSRGASGHVAGNVMVNNGDDGVDIDQASVLIERNRMQFNTGDAIEIRTLDTVAPWLTITMQDNVLSDNDQDGIQFIDDDVTLPTNALLVVERNLIANNVQAGIGFMDLSDTSEDFRAASLLERVHVFNNTIVGNDHGLSGGDNVIALNNIFADHTNIAVKNVDGASILAHNLFWANGTDETGSNVDVATSLSADPQFDVNYQLLPGSPAIDAGVAAFVLPSGEPVLQLGPTEFSGPAPDLGSFETVTTGTPNLPPTVDAGPDQFISLPTLSVALDGVIDDDGEPDPPGGTTSVWSQVGGPPGVTFADETAAATTATFPRSGEYVLRLTVSDSVYSISDQLLVSVVDPSLVTFEARVAGTTDDAEQTLSGAMSLGSSDLELGSDAGVEQIVGVRFSGVEIPPGVTIRSAVIQFQVDETDADPTSLTIRGEKTPSAEAFSGNDSELSSRELTTASVAWAPPAWTVVGADEVTPDLTEVLQEIIGQPGWDSGNAVAFVISGSGERTAEAYEGDAAGAPLLIVEYSTEPPVPNVPPVAIDDAAVTMEDVSVVVEVTANDTDEDGNLAAATTTIACELCAGPALGSVAANGDGTMEYTPDPDLNGTDTFTYQVCDTFAACDTATVTITIEPVDDPPSALDDNATTAIGTPITLDVSANDSDPDENLDPTTTATVTAPTFGSVENLGTGSFTYTPPVGFTGTDSFVYQICDTTNRCAFATVTIQMGTATFEAQVAASSDDAEEDASGNVGIGSSDLELVSDGSDQVVGLRFTGIEIPRSSTIASAHIQFQVDEATTEATNLVIHAEASDDASTFSTTDFTVSSRPTTEASASWSPAPWPDRGQAGPDQATPDLASLVQEVVLRPGWSAGNSMVFVITGSGRRVAESFDGDPLGAPRLVVEFGGSLTNEPPQVLIGDPSERQTFTAGTVIQFAGSATDTEDGDLSAELSWASDLQGDLGTGSSVSRDDLVVGTHRISATATDSQGSANSATVEIIVLSPAAVVVGAGDIAGCGAEKDHETSLLLDSVAGTVITLGDNAYESGTETEYDDCYGPTWGRHRSRTRPSAGNHDYFTPGAAGYFGYFGEAAGEPGKGYYSYDVEDWHVVVLNSECAEVGGCGAGSPQAQWLEADLAANPRDCTLAYWHRPRFSSGSSHGNDIAYQDFWEILYGAGVDVVLNGHEHVYERFAPQDAFGNSQPGRGIRQFTVGTGGRPLNDFVDPAQPNSEVRDASSHGVLKLTLGTSGYTWEFLPIAGDSFTDSGSDTCVDAAPPSNEAPTADAGPDQTIVLPGSATLSGSFTDDGLPDPPGAVTSLWELVSGPGTVTFGDAASLTTSGSFSTDGVYVLRLTIDDGELIAFDEVSITVDAAPPSNEAPLAADDEVAAVEDTDVTFAVLDNDTDLDGNLDPTSTNTTCAGCSEPTEGVLVNNGDGTFGYSPDRDVHGIDTFVYEVCDTLSACDTATVTITIQSVNDAPIAVDDDATTSEDQPVVLSPLSNDSDVDGDPLTVTNLTTPANGAVVDNGDGTITYTPAPGHTGGDTFTYTANDGSIDSSIATVTVVTNPSAPQIVEVRVASGGDDAEERPGGQVALTSSDLELVVDGSRGAQTVGMRFAGLDIPQGATVISAWIQFQADETSSIATQLTIEGQAIDDAPSFVNTSGNISLRSRTQASVTWSPPAWDSVGEAGSAQRTPDLSTVVAEIVTRPGWNTGSSLVILVTGDGSRVAESYNGSPGAAPLLHVEYVTEPIPNRPPIAADDTAVTETGVAVDVNVIENDTDPDGNLDVSSTNTDCVLCSTTANGTLQNLGSGLMRYTPDPQFEGTDTFVYEVCDDAGLCDRATAEITVTGATPQVIEVRVSTSSDDAEQRSTGNVSLTSSDLELAVDANRGAQTIGVRFTELNIPAGALITSAWVQFTADETGSEATDLVIAAEAADAAATFTNTQFDLTNRPLTQSEASWSPAAWLSRGEAGLAQRTPDLAALVQEVVARPGWQSGNALALIIDGTGTRTAESYNGDATAAPMLHVEYLAP